MSIEIIQSKNLFKLPYELIWRKYNDLNKLKKALQNKYKTNNVNFYEVLGYGGIIL